MIEALGVLHLLSGLTLVSLAVLVPVRSSDLTAGLALSGLFLVAGIERFTRGYYRLSHTDLSAHGPVVTLLFWNSIILVMLLLVLALALRAPERPRNGKNPGD